MPRATWGGSAGDRPFDDELDEFDVYEGEQPPKGVYRVRLKMLRVKQNKNNEAMLNGLLVIMEPKSSKKAQYNGYTFWFNLNVTKQGAAWVNNFLSVLVPENKVAATRKAFWDEKVMLDKEDPPNILSIGTIKLNLDDTPRYMKANTKFVPAKGDYDEKLDVLRFLRDSADADVEADEPDPDEEGYEEETEEPADYDEDEVAEREEELSELGTVELKKILKEHGFKISQYKGKGNEDLIEMILDQEFPEVEEDEDEDEEEGEDDTDSDDYEDEEQVEDEPQTQTKPARGRRKSTPAEEPAEPAGTRSGRRRKAGEPPF